MKDLPVKTLLSMRRATLADIRKANRRIADIDKVLRSHGVNPVHPADRPGRGANARRRKNLPRDRPPAEAQSKEGA